jgi:hypothetical protein
MRLRGVLVAPLVLAGCAGGGHAAPKVDGVYEATVRDPGHHAIRTVWLDAATGRFRVQTVFRDIGSATPVPATVTVFDGRVATQQVGRTRLIRITGSRRFVADRAGADVVASLRARLTGSALPEGVTVTRFRRLRHAGTGLFRTSTGTATGTIRQVAAGRPATGGSAYWLGSTWRGTTPGSASESTGDAGTAYDTQYPGVDVTVERSRGATLGCDGTPVRLADGTAATVVVVPINAQGTGQCSSSSDGSTTGVMVLSESTAAGTLAYVIAGDTVISLSCRAVTPASAAAIARALRPV